jgi:hypothetical protein
MVDGVTLKTEVVNDFTRIEGEIHMCPADRRVDGGVVQPLNQFRGSCSCRALAEAHRALAELEKSGVLRQNAAQAKFRDSLRTPVALKKRLIKHR